MEPRLSRRDQQFPLDRIATLFRARVRMFLGFILNKHPLRQIAPDARAGLILTVEMALCESFAGQTRIGLGENPANAAFVICVLAVTARFHASTAPKFLPNTHAWFYFAIIPVLTTETRRVSPVFAIAAIVDLIELRSRTRHSGKKTSNAAAGLVIFSIVAMKRATS